MRIPTTQRLIVEDFQDQKDWIGLLIGPINEFITNVLRVINGGMDFTSNFIGVEKELDFTYVDDATTFPQSIKWGLPVRPKALSIASAFENDPSLNRDFTPVIIAVAWALNASSEIEITSAVKLTSSGVGTLDATKRYKILVRAS